MVRSRRQGAHRNVVVLIISGFVTMAHDGYGAAPPREAPSPASHEAPVRDLPTLIARVRQNEAKYRQLELFVRRAGKSVGPAHSIAETQVKLHTVIAGDLVYCHVDETITFAEGKQQTRERVSAYD